jgi:hypothetical protein
MYEKGIIISLPRKERKPEPEGTSRMGSDWGDT